MCYQRSPSLQRPNLVIADPSLPILIFFSTSDFPLAESFPSLRRANHTWHSTKGQQGPKRLTPSKYSSSFPPGRGASTKINHSGWDRMIFIFRTRGIMLPIGSNQGHRLWPNLLIRIKTKLIQNQSIQIIKYQDNSSITWMLIWWNY